MEWQWLNEPPSWRDEDGELSVLTADRTDFWRMTHYGFIRDDGHMRYRAVSGDFTAEVSFLGAYEELYDQAGMMVRIDERNWLKAGIEFVGGRQMLSVVVTRDFSDWSTALAPADGWTMLRISRHGEAVRVEWSLPGPQPNWTLMRLAHLPPAPMIKVGPMCCSPQRAGFAARFRGFTLSPAVSRDLHAAMEQQQRPAVS
jgi:regulation of enolase protein 1 (concanavalin A-like superfamily)